MYLDNIHALPPTSPTNLTNDGIATLKISLADIEEANKRRLFETLIFFANYAIVIPAFLLCWFAFIRWLRRIGVINHPEGEQLAKDHIAIVREASAAWHSTGDPLHPGVSSIALPMLAGAGANKSHPKTNISSSTAVVKTNKS